MPGRVHVVHGDLTALDCDVAVVPTDALVRVEESWRGLVTQDEARAGVPAGWRGGPGARSVGIGRRDGDGPLRVLLEVAKEGSRPVRWYLDGVREALAGADGSACRPAPRRRRALVGLPLVGTGLGGSAGREESTTQTSLVSRELERRRTMRPLRLPRSVSSNRWSGSSRTSTSSVGALPRTWRHTWKGR